MNSCKKVWYFSN